jgi:LPS export ABC transporter protein LptC
MDVRNLLSLSGMLLVLGSAGYYWGMGHQRDTGLGEEERRHPDYVVTGIRGLETDAAGQPLRRLEAAALRHYDRPRDEAEVDRPVLTLYESGQEAWRMTAPRAISLDQNTEVRLEGGVHAERRLPDVPPLTFDTPTLFAFPQQERLFTNAGVTIASPRGRLASQGLEARVKTGDIMLTENVTGNYAPASR